MGQFEASNQSPIRFLPQKAQGHETSCRGRHFLADFVPPGILQEAAEVPEKPTFRSGCHFEWEAWAVFLQEDFMPDGP